MYASHIFCKGYEVVTSIDEDLSGYNKNRGAKDKGKISTGNYKAELRLQQRSTHLSQLL